MKVAKNLSHDDKYVNTMLDHAQHLDKEFPARSAMHPSAHATQTPASKRRAQLKTCCTAER